MNHPKHEIDLPYLTVEEDGTFVLTVTSEALNVCNQCPHLHVRITHVTVAQLHSIADNIHGLAKRW